MFCNLFKESYFIFLLCFEFTNTLRLTLFLLLVMESTKWMFYLSAKIWFHHIGNIRHYLYQSIYCTQVQETEISLRQKNMMCLLFYKVIINLALRWLEVIPCVESDSHRNSSYNLTFVLSHLWWLIARLIGVQPSLKSLNGSIDRTGLLFLI